MIAYQMSRPICFAWIRASGLNRIRYLIPAIGAALMLLIYASLWFAHVPVQVGKYAQILATALIGLPGFYIAALAAVASFQSASLDQLVETPGAKIKVVSKGGRHEIELTYRMYVCYLFAYLSVLSLALFLLLSVSPDGSRIVASLISSSIAAVILQITGSFLLLALVLNLLTVTLHGLYFLAERIHRPSA